MRLVNGGLAELENEIPSWNCYDRLRKDIEMIQTIFRPCFSFVHMIKRSRSYLTPVWTKMKRPPTHPTPNLLPRWSRIELGGKVITAPPHRSHTLCRFQGNEITPCQNQHWHNSCRSTTSWLTLPPPTNPFLPGWKWSLKKVISDPLLGSQVIPLPTKMRRDKLHARNVLHRYWYQQI